MKTILTIAATIILAVAFSSCQTAAKKDGCCGTTACAKDAKKH